MAALFAVCVLLSIAPAKSTAAESSTPWVLQPHERALAHDPHWAALLHHDGRQPNIQDPAFLLSGQAFTLETELQATLSLLYQGGPDAVCRFPARYLWIRAKTGRPALPIEQCAELSEFATKAPMEDVSLVFASEVLSMPSSMMGHLFLKVSGRHADGRPREHAVSFFTEPVSWNLPKLFYDSLIGGMQGYFSLTPFQQEAELYIGKEGRNLWIYPLRLNAAELGLLQAHIIELKHVRFTYFFQRYNCATLVKHLLAINRPSVLSDPEWWTSPKDVVRSAVRHDLVDNPTALTAARWTLRIIQEDLTATEVAHVAQQVAAAKAPEANAPATEKGFLQLKAAQALNLYLYETDQRTRTVWAPYARALQQTEKTTYRDWTLESNQRRDPVNAPPDTQWSVGVMQRQGDARVFAEILPASHKLEDDNSLYFAESSLALLNVAISTSLDKRDIKLERATIYGVESLLPRDALTGGWSGRFRMGWDQLRDSQLQERGAWLVEGGLGVTSRMHPDVDLYGLAVAGASTARRGHVYARPELGVIVRQVYGMKTIARLVVSHNELKTGRTFLSSELLQTKRFTGGVTVMLHLRHAQGHGQHQRETGVRLKYQF
ncbi:DUF4105 domain-containing protein [Aquabacterium sp. A3]|uniref:lipoprotein N-acyltransferase Lnb domain-containing protein n=1 Tax=Aquabacterium sp. A3 TaxID=3132829 RepID=UPI00311A36AA